MLCAECGVWRGGASIFAKAVLAAHGEAGRGVHLVDSFAGLPPNTTSSDQMYWNEMTYLRVSQAEVRAGFERFGLLDDGVHFHKVMRGGAGGAAASCQCSRAMWCMHGWVGGWVGG